MRKRGIHILLVILFVLATRVPFHSKYFFHWDTVQYVLGSQNYDFTLHHAHPPGYWVYVQVISLLNKIIKDYNLTIILINLICSIAACLCLYESGRHYRDTNLGWIIAGLFLLSPVIWLYNIVSINHITLTVLPSVFLYYYFRRDPPHYMEYIMMSSLAGFWTGIRQVETFLLLPFFVFVIMRHSKPLKVFLVCILTFGIVFSTWFPHFIKEAGGWSNYCAVSRLYYTTICFDKSILYGATLMQHVSHFPRAIMWLAADFGPMGMGMIFLVLLMYFRSGKFTYPFKRKETIALLSGILPLTFFYFGVYVGRPAYWFTLLPFLFFILSSVYYSSYKAYDEKRPMLVFLIVLCTLSLIYFIVPRFAYHALFKREMGKPSDQQSREKLDRFITYTKYSSSEALHRDMILEIITGGLGKFTASKDSRAFGYVDFGAAIDWRRCSYYLPQIPFLTIIENKTRKEYNPMALLAQDNKVQYINKKKDLNKESAESWFGIMIPEGYRYFILIPDVSSKDYERFQASYHPQKIGMPLNPAIYYVDLKEAGLREITYGKMKFTISQETGFKME